VNKIEINDESVMIPSFSLVCSRCAHYDRAEPFARKCSAFPDGIPMPIWMGRHKHDTPYRGDGGIQFELAPDMTRVKAT
jgi:hypothetical protein